MAYIPLNDTDIEAGKPVKEELFQQIKENEEFFNDAVEAFSSSTVLDMFNIKFEGDMENYDPDDVATRIPVFKAPAAGTIQSFVITLLEASTSGSIQIDIDKSVDNGINWTALLNNPVEVTGTTIGSISSTVDYVDLASQSFDQGDLLRLRISGLQSGQGDFHVAIYAELG